MKQTRRSSAIETIASTTIGFLVAGVANWLVLPLWGLHPKLGESFAIGLVFTAISLIRGYLVRRIFATLHHEGILP